MSKVDTAALLARIDLVQIVGRYVDLRRAGREFAGLCPFHEEHSPSFTVQPAKGFVHCFGCGAHHDAIGFLMRVENLDFREAVRQLDSGALPEVGARAVPVRTRQYEPEQKWVPLMPVSDDAPDLMADDDWTVPVFNPKRGRAMRMRLQRLDAYRNAQGGLLGYVGRAQFEDRDTGRTRKWTPQITWCISPTGAKQWCLQAFPEPRPLLGLDDLAARPGAVVVVFEGEKCRAAGAGAWPQIVAVSWAGGSFGVGKTDWTPLAGRDVILWPDADEAGKHAMCGWRNDAGDSKPGVAQFLARVGARSIRMIDTHGQPKGWDVADAFEHDGWTPAQAATWAASRGVAINVVRAAA